VGIRRRGEQRRSGSFKDFIDGLIYFVYGGFEINTTFATVHHCFTPDDAFNASLGKVPHGPLHVYRTGVLLWQLSSTPNSCRSLVDGHWCL